MFKVKSRLPFPLPPPSLTSQFLNFLENKMALPPSPIPTRPTPKDFSPPKPVPEDDHEPSGHEDGNGIPSTPKVTEPPSEDLSETGRGRTLLNHLEDCKFGHFQTQLARIMSTLKVEAQHARGYKKPSMNDQEFESPK